MLSMEDLEKIIAMKRLEIENEKVLLGLSPHSNPLIENEKANTETSNTRKQVNFQPSTVLCEHNAITEDKKERDSERNLYDLEENIPPGLERYIRRYIGLPVMLKAGEFSPNNPLLRGERTSGDALLGLGEYERRRNTLRKIRQQQYREYLDQQAKKKQDAKDQAEKERREREEKEREREQKEREILLERDRYSPEWRRLSLNHVPTVASVPFNKVDTGVQMDGVARPLSVAVQTDDVELYRLSPSPSKWELTPAERELSPRAVAPRPAPRPRALRPRPGAAPARTAAAPRAARRRSCGDCDERTSSVTQKTNRDKLVSDLRHTYMPSIFDEDAIQLRNLQAEKEAAMRRQYHQQELKNQIQEQQRIREERKSREKMLEQAEMRRLEEQLRMLQLAQEREFVKQRDISAAIKEHAKDYEVKRTELQRGVDEQKKLLRAPARRADSNPARRPTGDGITNEPPFSFNIPDTSVFSSKYDVDSYLRRNLNFKSMSNKYDSCMGNVVNPKNPGGEPKINNTQATGPSFEKETKNVQDVEGVSIPVLRHSPKTRADFDFKTSDLSDPMKIVEDKWTVPAVQKNVLKTMPSEDGRNINILTQLGSIRRQLQLEQMKLDEMLSKDGKVPN